MSEGPRRTGPASLWPSVLVLSLAAEMARQASLSFQTLGVYPGRVDPLMLASGPHGHRQHEQNGGAGVPGRQSDAPGLRALRTRPRMPPEGSLEPASGVFTRTRFDITRERDSSGSVPRSRSLLRVEGSVPASRGLGPHLSREKVPPPCVNPRAPACDSSLLY